MKIYLVVTTVILSLFTSSLCAQDVLTPELLWKLKRIGSAKIAPDGTKALYDMRVFDMEKNSGNTDLFIYDFSTGKSTQITQTPFSEMDAVWDQSNRIWFMTTETGKVQLYRMNATGTDKKQISYFESKEIEGFTLSPMANSVVVIAPVKVKKTLVEEYPDLKLANARVEDDLMYRHWNAWSDENKKHLFYHKIEGDKITDLGIDLLDGELVDGVQPPFGGSDQVQFNPTGTKIAYSTKKLVGKEFALSTNSEVYEYTIETGKTTLISKNHLGYDNSPTYLKTSNQIAFLSMKRNGFEADKNDLILRDLSNGSEKNLTAKMDITVSQYVFSSDEKKVYFIAPIKGTDQVFEIDLKKETIKQITNSMHDYLSLSVSSNRILAARQSMIEPTDLVEINTKSYVVNRITEVNKEILSKLSLPHVKEKWVTTSDGKKMLTWHILPPNFDETKAYPTLLYCQGGPQSMVSQFFSYRWNFAVMASQGYVIVAPNRRGLPGFGQAWNDAISKDWGGQAIQDYLSAIDTAMLEKYVDKDKLGCIGASYGGYSAYFLAGNHEGRFKTFIAHCGLFNLESWYGTTEELFFANWDNKGPYWKAENKAYYQKNSPHNYVQNWDTPILVIHGGMDFRVPESEGMQAFQAAQLLGLKSKYLYFPTEGHWVSSPQNGLLWQREFFKWLASDLKP